MGSPNPFYDLWKVCLIEQTKLLFNQDRNIDGIAAILVYVGFSQDEIDSCFNA